MKIKTRDTKLKEYCEKYPITYSDIELALKQYFNIRKWDMNKAVAKAKKRIKSIEKHRIYKNIKITLYEFPMKTDRPRSTFRGITYSPNAKANNIYLSKAIKSINKTIKLLNTPATIVIDAYLEMPEQVPPEEVLLYECKILQVEDTPDYDNIGKCYTDMQKNNIVVDDDIFWSGTINKFYSVVPRVEIHIRYIEKHESKYIYKKLKNRKTIKELLNKNMIEFEFINEGD